MCNLSYIVIEKKEKKRETGMAILFILWNYSFMQGIFHFNAVNITNILVLRGEQKVKKQVQKLLRRNEYPVVVVELSEKVKVLEQRLENISESFVILDCKSINSTSERRAVDNFQRILKLSLNDSREEGHQQIFPILWIESMLPTALGLQLEDVILLDLETEDFNIPVMDEQLPFGNLDYVEEAIQFVEEKYAVFINDIEKNKSLAKNSSWEELKIVAAVIAFIYVKKDYGDHYENVKKNFLGAITCLQEFQENCIEAGDILEVFRIQLTKYLNVHKLEYSRRDSLNDFKLINCEDSIYEDDKFYYFKRKLLENVCYGELRQIPFLRILRQLEEEGFLKVSPGTKNNKTVVTNLIRPSLAECRQIRLIAINKDFMLRV